MVEFWLNEGWKPTEEKTGHAKTFLMQLIGVGLLTCALLAIGLGYRQGEKQQRIAMNQKILGEQAAISLPTPSIQPTLSLATTPPVLQTVFLIQIRPKNNQVKLEKPLIQTILEIIDPEGIRKIQLAGIFYDTRVTDPYHEPDSTNADYLTVQLAGDLATREEWETEQYDLVIQAENEKLKPFLLNREFCLKDTDCIVRSSFCTTGLFNKYDRVAAAYACPNGQATKTGIKVNSFDSAANCQIKVEFDNPHCEANTCVEVGEKFGCE